MRSTGLAGAMTKRGGLNMDLVILKKKIDGYRASSGSIKNVPPELLFELRQTWEHYTGSPEQFRSELGVKMGTLRNLLKESKKLNHVIASAGAVGLAVEGGSEVRAPDQPHSEGNGTSGPVLELAFDHGSKVIRFSSVDLLIDFMRKSA
jgi:hypothetical protein